MTHTTFSHIPLLSQGLILDICQHLLSLWSVLHQTLGAASSLNLAPPHAPPWASPGRSHHCKMPRALAMAALVTGSWFSPHGWSLPSACPRHCSGVFYTAIFSRGSQTGSQERPPKRGSVPLQPVSRSQTAGLDTKHLYPRSVPSLCLPPPPSVHQDRD